MTIANLDSSIAFKSSIDIYFPLSSSSLSLKVKMPFCFKAAYKWSVKLLWVSMPLKLRKTSYFHWAVEEESSDEVGAPPILMETDGNILLNLKLQYRYKLSTLKNNDKKI